MSEDSGAAGVENAAESTPSSIPPGEGNNTTTTSESVTVKIENIIPQVSKLSTEEPRTPVANFPWAPDPEEVVRLFEDLTRHRFFDFSWECPGRKNPYEVEKRIPEPETTSDFPKEAEAGADDFDFEEESTPMIRRPTKVTQSPLLKGSAKKRTTSLAGILSNMERHRIMDKMQSVDIKKEPQS